jgi:N-acetylneuraminate synthase
MPKEGFSSVTIPEELEDRISEFLDMNKGIVSNKTQALAQAWQIYENMFNSFKNPRPVKIGNKFVGHHHPTYFIAEIGINHNGDMRICKQLIDAAVDAGCDAVKFQKRVPEIAVPEHYKNKMRETPWGEMTYLDYKKKIEFWEDDFKELDEYCKAKDVVWFASVWDIPSIEFIEQFDTPCYKIPSASLTDSNLIKALKATGKPIIISSGMSSAEETERAMKILGEENVILMQCTSTYPCKDEDFDINVINTFRKKYNCPIGFSGHEPGFLDTVIATSIGACIVEKHITIDHSLWGTDQASSLDPKQLREAVNYTKRITTMLGGHEKKVHEAELSTKDKLRNVFE